MKSEIIKKVSDGGKGRVDIDLKPKRKAYINMRWNDGTSGGK